jgi:hypothetical protein
VSPPRDLRDRQARGRRQNDPSPRHVFWGTVAIGDDRLETSTVRSRHSRTDDLSHGQHRTFLRSRESYECVGALVSNPQELVRI